MDVRRFDRLTKTLARTAAGASRRAVLRLLTGGAVGALLTRLGAGHPFGGLAVEAAAAACRRSYREAGTCRRAEDCPCRDHKCCRHTGVCCHDRAKCCRPNDDKPCCDGNEHCCPAHRPVCCERGAAESCCRAGERCCAGGCCPT